MPFCSVWRLITMELELEIFKLIVEQLDGVAITDEKGRYIYVNDSWKSYTGFTFDEIKGKYVHEVMPSTKINEALKTGKRILGNPTPFYTEEGRQGFSSYIPIIKEGKIVAGFIHVIFNDMETAMNFSDIVSRMTDEIKHYKQELRKIRGTKYSIDNIIGESESVKNLKKQIRASSKSISTVLIEGETGSGKELIAHSIHDLSNRAFNPFIKVNCAAIPSGLLESEFFGYESGSFTGAKTGGKEGKFEMANKGSIFLDEINQMPLDVQPKFLRVLQEKEVERIGGKKSIPLNVRIIVATNISLEKLVKENKFRSDLFYRLNVINIKIPPLRERKEDIPLLVENIIDRLNFQLGMSVDAVTNEVNERLKEYNWPGNIRELQNVVERAMNLGLNGVLNWEHFEEYFENKKLNKRRVVNRPKSYSVKDMKKDFEKELIVSALAECNFNKTKSAKLLGISRTLLYQKIKEYNIE
jgi:transcriptional regulator with PAS, ATPase and Fis domain